MRTRPTARVVATTCGRWCRIPLNFGVNAFMSLSSAPYRWTKVAERAPFAGRDGAGALVFKDRMWLLGGWNPEDKVNFPIISNSEVWSSTDGADWKLEIKQAPWEGRHCAGYVVHDGRMWVLGGDTSQKHYQDDVWCSEDGVRWECVTKTTPWSPRVFHYAVAHAGKIWVIGGQTLLKHVPTSTEAYFNDVWCSEDGARWERVTEHAPWIARGMIGGSAVWRGRIWLPGGGTFENPRKVFRTLYNEVWSTADGVDWRLECERAAWPNRQFHEVAVWDDKLWVMEGFRLNYETYSDGQGPLEGNLNDVWYSADGKTWHEVPDTPWAPRHAASVFVYRDALWMVAGNNMQPDVWKLTRA